MTGTAGSSDLMAIARDLCALPLEDFIAHAESALACGPEIDPRWYAAEHAQVAHAVHHARFLLTAQTAVRRELGFAQIAARRDPNWPSAPDGSPRFQQVLSDAEYLATLGGVRAVADQIRSLRFVGPVPGMPRSVAALRAARYGVRMVDRRSTAPVSG